MLYVFNIKYKIFLFILIPVFFPLYFFASANHIKSLDQFILEDTERKKKEKLEREQKASQLKDLFSEIKDVKQIPQTEVKGILIKIENDYRKSNYSSFCDFLIKKYTGEVALELEQYYEVPIKQIFGYIADDESIEKEQKIKLMRRVFWAEGYDHVVDHWYERNHFLKKLGIIPQAISVTIFEDKDRDLYIKSLFNGLNLNAKNQICSKNVLIKLETYDIWGRSFLWTRILYRDFEIIDYILEHVSEKKRNTLLNMPGEDPEKFGNNPTIAQCIEKLATDVRESYQASALKVYLKYIFKETDQARGEAINNLIDTMIKKYSKVAIFADSPLRYAIYPEALVKNFEYETTANKNDQLNFNSSQNQIKAKDKYKLVKNLYDSDKSSFFQHTESSPTKKNLDTCDKKNINRVETLPEVEAEKDISNLMRFFKIEKFDDIKDFNYTFNIVFPNIAFVFAPKVEVFYHFDSPQHQHIKAPVLDNENIRYKEDFKLLLPQTEAKKGENNISVNQDFYSPLVDPLKFNNEDKKEENKKPLYHISSKNLFVGFCFFAIITKGIWHFLPQPQKNHILSLVLKLNKNISFKF